MQKLLVMSSNKNFRTPKLKSLHWQVMGLIWYKNHFSTAYCTQYVSSTIFAISVLDRDSRVCIFLTVYIREKVNNAVKQN